MSHMHELKIKSYPCLSLCFLFTIGLSVCYSHTFHTIYPPCPPPPPYTHTHKHTHTYTHKHTHTTVKHGNRCTNSITSVSFVSLVDTVREQCILGAYRYPARQGFHPHVTIRLPSAHKTRFVKVTSNYPAW